VSRVFQLKDSCLLWTLTQLGQWVWRFRLISCSWWDCLISGNTLTIR